MTTDEFKLWFEGFADALDGPPNAHQWGTIREKLADTVTVTLSPWTSPWPVPYPNVPNTPEIGSPTTNPSYPIVPTIWYSDADTFTCTGIDTFTCTGIAPPGTLGN
jgi:hypothetical protein